MAICRVHQARQPLSDIMKVSSCRQPSSLEKLPGQQMGVLVLLSKASPITDTLHACLVTLVDAGVWLDELCMVGFSWILSFTHVLLILY